MTEKYIPAASYERRIRALEQRVLRAGAVGAPSLLLDGFGAPLLPGGTRIPSGGLVPPDQKPPDPTGLVLTPGAGGGAVWLDASWTPAALNAAGPVVSWLITATEDGETLPLAPWAPLVSQAPPFRLGGLKPDTGYTVVVRAVTATGASSTGLSGHQTTGHDTTPPAKVTGVGGGPGYKSVTLSWTKLTGFTGTYRVRVSTHSDMSGYTEYDAGQASVLQVGNLTTGTAYYFVVVARSLSAVYGTPSDTFGPVTPGLADAVYQPSDGNPPTTTTPAPTLKGGPGFIFVKWAPITNPDVVTYEVHISTTAGFTPNSGTKAAEVVGGSTAFLKLTAGGTNLAYATNYYVAIKPKDADGYSTAGPSPVAGPVQLVQVDTADLAVGSITAASGIILDLTADIITTGTLDASVAHIVNLSADDIVAGTLSSDIIYTGTLDAAQITTGILDASVIDVINLDADNIVAGHMAVGRLSAGTIGAILIQLASGGIIESANFVGGTSGWQMDGAGNLEANSAIFRGVLAAVEIAGDDLTIYGQSGRVSARLFTELVSGTPRAWLQLGDGAAVGAGINWHTDFYHWVLTNPGVGRPGLEITGADVEIAGLLRAAGSVMVGGNPFSGGLYARDFTGAIDTHWGYEIATNGSTDFFSRGVAHLDGTGDRRVGWFDANAGTWLAYADTSKNLQARVAWNIFSSKTIKRQIKPLKAGSARDKLARSQPSTFVLADDEPRRYPRVGFIAENEMDAFPELVQVNDAPDMPPYSIDYTGYIPFLVRDVNDLAARLDALEAAK